MRGSWSLIALAAGSLLLGGAHGALADHQRSGFNGDKQWSRYKQNDQGSGYQQSAWHTDRSVQQEGRQRPDDGWRTGAADRAVERGHRGWEQQPFTYIRATDRVQRGAANGCNTSRGGGYHRSHRD
jgi:hypothetical protein